MKRTPLLIPLLGIYLFCGTAVSGGRVVATLYALSSGTAESTVGVLVGLYGFLPMFFSIVVGKWADRVGPLTPIRAGIVAIAAAVVAAALLPRVVTLFLLATACGIGFNLVTVAGQYAVGRLHDDPARRVANFGWFSLGQATANVVGPLVAGVYIDHYGHRAAFAALAVSAGCALVLAVAWGPGLKGLHGGAAKAGTSRGAGATLLGSAEMRRIYLVGLLLSMVWDVFTFLMPILGHRQHLSASVIGVILAAFAVGMFTIRLLTPWLGRRFAEWTILRVAVVVVALVYVVLPLVHYPPVLIIIGYVFGTAVGCSQPNMLSLLHASAPVGRGAEAVGFRQMLCNASGVFVPVLFGAVAGPLGVFPIYWGVAAVTACSLPMTRQAASAQPNCTT